MPTLFAVAAGLFFFVSILKFGTPIILDNHIIAPENAAAAVYESWQIKWGYRFLAVLLCAGLAATPWMKRRFKWLLVLPLLWLGWQFFSSAQSVSPALSSMTVHYFAACVILFYLGYFALGAARNPWPLWAGLALALCWMMHTGLEQQFGGLEATRRYIYSLQQTNSLTPEMKDPDFMKRVASPRIFATFSSPDAFAGAIELLLPVTLVFLWQLTPKIPPRPRWLFVAILGGVGLACLYWSGSRAGWLVTLLAGLIALARSTLSAKWKRGLICGALVLGAAGFAVKNSAFFKKDKNSVGSRFAYWRVACQVIREHPILGTGPGTFEVPYKKMKQPDDEATRLCHNDYLEQASDSGIPAAVIYAGMIVGSLTWTYRYRVKKSPGLSLEFAVWLGLATLAIHSLVDYHLYMPALGWPMFFLLGFMLNSID